MYCYYCYRYQSLFLPMFLLSSCCWMPSVLRPLLFDIPRSTAVSLSGLREMGSARSAGSALGLGLRLLCGVCEVHSMPPWAYEIYVARSIRYLLALPLSSPTIACRPLPFPALSFALALSSPYPTDQSHSPSAPVF